MRGVTGAVLTAVLLAAPVAASADIVTITMVGLSENDGATITATDVFKYDSGAYQTTPTDDQQVFNGGSSGLIKATVTISPAPGQPYAGPPVTYVLRSYGGDTGLLLERNAAPPGLNPLAYFEMNALNLPVPMGYSLYVYDSWLRSGSLTPPNNLDTAFSVGAFTNLSFADHQIGGGVTCLPGYGPCNGDSNQNGDAVIFGFRITVAPDLAPVPEPASWALMLSGLAFTGGALRRRIARAAG